MFFCKKGTGDTAELEKQNKIMQTALEFYADVKSWESGHKYTDSNDATIFTDGSESAATVDKGSHAFKALKSCKA
ncbi:MAG: hypothetical protein IIC11_06795 [Proteobacteria bacterium]|nr:hypothetical protein [Pseudomonadota bacterium]